MRIIPVIIILIGIFIFGFIFDHRQDFIYDNTDNGYNSDNANLDLVIPNKAIFPIQDINNSFLLYDDDEYIDGYVYPLLSDASLFTRIEGKGNSSYKCKIGYNNEIGSLLGCYIIWNTHSYQLKYNKTLRITMLKNNQSIILFQETAIYKEASEFSVSYIILNSSIINNEIIIIESIVKYHWEIIYIYEFYLLIISDDDLLPKVKINHLEAFFFLDIELYYDNKKIIKFCLFVFSLIFYIHFYIKQNKKLKKCFTKYD